MAALAAVMAAAAAAAAAVGSSWRDSAGRARAQPPLFVSSHLLRHRASKVGSRGGVALRAELEDTPEYKAFAERHLVDEVATEREADFPIQPSELIKLTKRFLATEAPEATLPGDGSLMTEDFQFIGPVIGPLDKEEFMATRNTVDFFRSFPDATAQFHHFRVDPFEPSRVWYTARGTGQHTGEAVSGSDAALLFGEPSGIQYRNPPQACSCRFTRDGRVDQFTIGYVMDRYIGNTGGLGGFFGVLYAIGKKLPFEEAKAWQPSWAYSLYVEVGRLFGRLRMLSAKTEEERYILEKGMIKMPAATDARDG